MCDITCIENLPELCGIFVDSNHKVGIQFTFALKCNLISMNHVNPKCKLHSKVDMFKIQKKKILTCFLVFAT